MNTTDRTNAIANAPDGSLVPDEEALNKVAAEVAAVVLPKPKPGPKKLRKTVAVKVVADTPAKPKAKATPKPKRRAVTINGETVMVDVKLSNSEALVVARKLIASKGNRKNGDPDGKNVGTTSVKGGAKKVTARTTPTGSTKQLASVPTGSVRVRFSKTSYELAIAGKAGVAFRKANPVIAKAVRNLEGKTSGGAGYPAYFAVLPIAEAAVVVAHLRAVAKEWAGMSKAPGSPKPLLANADRIAADAKAAKK